MSLDVTDLVRLADELVHVCTYVSFNGMAYMACGTRVDAGAKEFRYCEAKRDTVTCMSCAAWSGVLFTPGIHYIP